MRYTAQTREEAACALSMQACACTSSDPAGRVIQYVEFLCDDPEAGELAATAFEIAYSELYASPLAHAYAEAEALVRSEWTPTPAEVSWMQGMRAVEGDW